MLTLDQEKEIKKALDDSVRPFFFFHDDPDGLSSFLLFYRYKKEGRGFVLKAVPNIKESHLKNAAAFDSDVIFILDLAVVDQEFLDKAKLPVYWIDHHVPLERTKVRYYNPRITFKQNIPTPVMCYQIVKQDLWIATVGSVGDWFMPAFAEDFKKEYPDLLPENVTTVEDALCNTKLGILVKVFSFLLKGKTDKVYQNIKTLTRIKSPYEILDQTTSQGKFLWKYYEQINKQYEELLKSALEKKTNGKLVVYTYSNDKLSLTKDLANELIAKFQDKIIVLGREKEDEVRCSLRAGKGVRLDLALEKVLHEVEGYGGGHEQACGAAIKQKDFKKFLELLEKELA
ncbi:DHH family phosphoesterase [Candidatus Woesearchaeota archaeon]|nr:DHH family phosphoesterase [Candidatus Woesearchaeota archaeon]